ncbi:coiled-coil domain-containing protein 141-like [Salarias fasciatus]|uniref:coiled-coil domain-containing protein 141-like n=1 Tax=Salarias fasciatus TaxID=181472 RepID=UPI0011765E33|nr:coiled-coil domain-containing protein 141-like [Salarias fasciatus]
MTTGDPEQPCGGNRKSATALSTIAVQAGQSQLVVSVLKSGSAIHLQLVQAQPGLCEIGSSQEENQTLIQELQQLLDTLRNREADALAEVQRKQRTELSRREQHWRSQEDEEEERVFQAMVASLKEGWSVLLRLLQRRLRVLLLAADFYQRALEFAVSISRVDSLQTSSNQDRLIEAQLSYESTRRELLQKSLQVLNSSNILLQKLRQLQKTEALQRRGGILQEEEEEEEESCSGSRVSGGALEVELLVERLQDRRRRADQVLRLWWAKDSIVDQDAQPESETDGPDKTVRRV